MPSIKRALRHLGASLGSARRYFPAEDRVALERAVHEGELRHCGEIRVVIETSLPVGHAWAGTSARARARALFGLLEVWNTAEHTGVLLYINLADHAVELLADRGIDACVGPKTWRAVCDRLTQGLARELSVRPVLAAVAEIHDLLAAHFPSDGRENPNELDDRPIIL